jgi:hypothetical protein
MVVLNELVGDPELGEEITPVGLEEEAAAVAMHDRFDQHGAVENGGQRTHGGNVAKLLPG